MPLERGAYCRGRNATTSIEDIAAAQPTLPLWFQLYNWDDRDALAGVIARAEAAGAKAIVPLVNTPIGVNHTSPNIGFRLPAGVTFAHFETSPGLATNTWEYIDVAPIGDVVADRAEGDHDPR